MVETAFIEQLRQALPQLLWERPEVRYELWGMMLEASPSRQEFMDLLEEMRASRQDANSRFEAADRRFEEMRQDANSRFVQQHLLIQDEAGEVFGVAGVDVEFDLYAHNGVAYLVEVKSHLKVNDVLSFYRKVKFAEGKLGRTVIPLVIALIMESKAEQQMKALGVKYHVRAVVTERSADF
jgi:hypothetical protein